MMDATKLGHAYVTFSTGRIQPPISVWHLVNAFVFSTNTNHDNKWVFRFPLKFQVFIIIFLKFQVGVA